MKNKINKLLSALAAKINARDFAAGREIVVSPASSACSCDDNSHRHSASVITGPWSPEMPHPNTRFPTLRVRRLPIVQMTRCSKCGKVSLASGYHYAEQKRDA